MFKIKYCVLKINVNQLFSLNSFKLYANILCVSIFIKDIVWYLGVVIKLYHCKCLIYIFTREVIDGNPRIFTNSQYHCWFKE